MAEEPGRVAWTSAVAATLAPGERDLFWFLCCLEEPDRERAVLNATWAPLWRRLGRGGPPPGLSQALGAVAAAGLATPRAAAGDASEPYALRPEVAEAGRDQAGTAFRDAADTEAAVYWAAVYQEATGAADGGVHTRRAVRAGLAAVPYLLRQQRWADATHLLEGAFLADPSRANATAMLPAITQAARHDPGSTATLALVLQVLDPAAAEAVLRDELASALAIGDYRAASAMAGRLVDACRGSGRLAEALDLADLQIGYTRQAGLGPWTQLADQVQRLQVLVAMGHADHVLAEVTRLRDHVAALPATATVGPGEMAIPWNAREALLDTGYSAALQLGQWDEALNLNAAVAASKRDRRAPADAIALTRFNDYGPLLRLGRTDDALALLEDCLRAFQDAGDSQAIGSALSGLADAEDQRGRGDAAIGRERDALRHLYLAGDVGGVAVSYHNLGNYLHRHARQFAPALACHLAAALIRALTGSEGVNRSAAAAATDLHEFDAAPMPATVADLGRQLGDLPGTDLPGLIARVCPDAEDAEDTLGELTALVEEVALEAWSSVREKE